MFVARIGAVAARAAVQVSHPTDSSSASADRRTNEGKKENRPSPTTAGVQRQARSDRQETSVGRMGRVPTAEAARQTGVASGSRVDGGLRSDISIRSADPAAAVPVLPLAEQAPRATFTLQQAGLKTQKFAPITFALAKKQRQSHKWAASQHQLVRSRHSSCEDARLR